MDSEEIRQALAERLSEADDEIRGEALIGLVSVSGMIETPRLQAKGR
jgi:hypothetical protein